MEIWVYTYFNVAIFYMWKCMCIVAMEDWKRWRVMRSLLSWITNEKVVHANQLCNLEIKLNDQEKIPFSRIKKLPIMLHNLEILYTFASWIQQHSTEDQDQCLQLDLNLSANWGMSDKKCFILTFRLLKRNPLS